MNPPFSTRLAVPSSVLATVLVTVMATLIATLWYAMVWAATPAGSVIRNQASATYKDSAGVSYTVTSNVVETLIQQVAGLSLTQSRSKPGRSGQSIGFPHTLANTGNGADTFFLLAANRGNGDDFNFSNLSLFADQDQDGQADNNSAITATPELAPGEIFHFVAVATVPGGVSNTDTGVFDVTATSQFSSTAVETNTDTVTITTRALIEVSKSLSQLNGSSPDGPVTVTLTVRNTSSVRARDVYLIDALPAGMSYIPGSARSSLLGNTVLTDANPNDTQGTGIRRLRYCAYDPSCTGLPEAQQDVDSASSNQVTVWIRRVRAATPVTITFDVSIDPGLDAQSLVNTAEFEYNNGGQNVPRADTNSVSFQIDAQAAVVANGSATDRQDGAAEPVSVASAIAGTSITFDNYIWNTGNATDNFDILLDEAASSFPLGTVFSLLQSDGQTPMVDSDGNGIPDTGPLAAGARMRVVLRALLPAAAAGNNAGAGYVVTKTARSIADPAQSNPVTDRLDNIVPGLVDLTNDAGATDNSALGVGPGPEAAAQKQLAINPGQSGRFSLYINNQGSVAESYALAASTDQSFAALTLPAGWTVTFLEADGSTVYDGTNTVAAGNAMLVYADVSVAANALPGTQSLYFRALSTSSAAVDIKHDAVDVATVLNVQLEPDSSGQVDQGGSIVFQHLIANSGNTPVSTIALSIADSLVVEGWSSVLYEDSNQNGVLDSADSTTSAIASLAIGEIRTLFVKVFAPANAPLAAVNTTTLEASWNSGANTLSVTDVTTVNTGDISILKEQAPDFNCDNAPDSAFSTSSFEVEPGLHCVIYRLTATNTGTQPLFNAQISDATPAFTVYRPAATCSDASCVITEPAASATGTVSGEVATIAPGGQVEFVFTVLVE